MDGREKGPVLCSVSWCASSVVENIRGGGDNSSFVGLRSFGCGRDVELSWKMTTVKEPRQKVGPSSLFVVRGPSMTLLWIR